MRNYQFNQMEANPSTDPSKTDIKESLQKIKRPYLNRIEMSKLKIKSQLHSQNKRISLQTTQLAEFIKELENKQNKKPSKFCKIEKPQKQITIDQQIKQDLQQIKQDLQQIKQDKKIKEQESLDSCFTQWKGRGKQNSFQNSTQMNNAYNSIFTNNTSKSCLKKNQLVTDFSYRRVQKQMLDKIFSQLKNNDQETVNFQRLIKFLHECQLFLTIYGIDKKQIYNSICCAAHKYSDKLTKQEFIQFFLNNSTVKEQGHVQSNIIQSCCLSQQHWNSLKKIFDQLDTFGDGFINVKQFFHKMKTVSVCKQLLQANTIQFPTIKKFYTFKKLIFVLQNKKTISQALSWQALKNLIQNFEFIDYPSIDEIFAESIMNANITKDLNTFLLEDDALSKLKSIFERCPKFCKYFVNKKYFCDQLLHLDCIKQVLTLSVRKDNHQNIVSLQGNIKILQSYGPQYFDMDQMLQLFSIKEIQHEKQKHNANDAFQLSSNASDQEFQKNKLYLLKIKRVKSADKINKCRKNSQQFIKENRQKRKIQQPAKFQQFQLTKKRAEPSIRQKKLLQMLKQKQIKQKCEIKSYIAANPIPSCLTNQNYNKKMLQYKKKLDAQKQLHISETCKSKQRITYLMTNTKIFQGCYPKQQAKVFQLHKQQTFQPKPISWFIKETNLLKTIQAEKEQRRINRLQQTRDKYADGYWQRYVGEAGEAAQLPPPTRKNTKRSTIAYNVQNNQGYQRYQTNQTQEIQLSSNAHQQYQQFKIKPTVVPDFIRLQRQFAEQLSRKKQMKSPTKIQQFNLSVNKEKVDIQPLNLSIKNKPAKVKPTKVEQNKPIIGTTRKFEEMVGLNHRRIAQREQKMQKIKKQQLQRKIKQKIFAKYMKSALKDEQNQKIKPINKKTKNKLNRQSQLQDQHQKEMKKIYQRVLSRPFLFQSTKTTKETKEKKLSAKSRGKKVLIPKQQREHDYLNQVQQEQWQQQCEQKEYQQQDQQGQYNKQDQQYQQEQQEQQEQYQQSDQSDQYNDKANNQRNLHNQSF